MNRGRTIVFSHVNQFTDLFGGLARYLRSNHKINSVLLHAGELPDPHVYDLSRNDFMKTLDYQDMLQPISIDKLPSASELSELSNAAERQYQVRINELIRADRHLGAGFIHGVSTPISRYERRFSHGQATYLVVQLLRYFDDLLALYQPWILVAHPADTARMALTVVAERRGIPVRVLSPNYSNVAFQWRVDRYFWPAGLKEAFAREASGRTEHSFPDTEPTVEVASSRRTDYARRSLQEGQSILAPLGSAYRLIRRQVGDIVKRRQKPYGGYALGAAITSSFATWYARRYLSHIQLSNNYLTKGQEYLFFPLVVEPETTLQCEAPMADNQLSLIDWLSKILPGGWFLVVKEHPGFTYPRPSAFWKQIRRYPNVRVASIVESGEVLAQNARIVAVINGTLGLQAAVAGIPVLTFHPRWWGRLLPHVAHADSYEAAARAVRELADESQLPPISERRRLGQALERALDVGSVPLTDPRLLNEKALGEPTPIADVKSIAEALMGSLQEQASALQEVS